VGTSCEDEVRTNPPYSSLAAYQARKYEHSPLGSHERFPLGSSFLKEPFSPLRDDKGPESSSLLDKVFVLHPNFQEGRTERGEMAFDCKNRIPLRGGSIFKKSWGVGGGIIKIKAPERKIKRVLKTG